MEACHPKCCDYLLPIEELGRVSVVVVCMKRDQENEGGLAKCSPATTTGNSQTSHEGSWPIRLQDGAYLRCHQHGAFACADRYTYRTTENVRFPDVCPFNEIKENCVSISILHGSTTSEDPVLFATCWRSWKCVTPCMPPPNARLTITKCGRDITEPNHMMPNIHQQRKPSILACGTIHPPYSRIRSLSPFVA